MGRPRCYDERLTESIRVRVTEAQRERLQRLAETNLTDVAGVIRDAVDAYVLDCEDATVFRGTKKSERQTIEQ